MSKCDTSAVPNQLQHCGHIDNPKCPSTHSPTTYRQSLSLSPSPISILGKPQYALPQNPGYEYRCRNLNVLGGVSRQDLRSGSSSDQISCHRTASSSCVPHSFTNSQACFRGHLAARMDALAGNTSGIEELQRTAHIRVDSNGGIVGVLGLNLRPTMHELSIGGSRLWVWCSFDVIGIFGAIRASGLARSVDPCNGENILLEFADGIPQNRKHIAFMADV